MTFGTTDYVAAEDFDDIRPYFIVKFLQSL